jgi:hypothetical protein
MSALLASEPIPNPGPLYRSMVIVDLEGSTQRNNPAKGRARRILYDLLDRALDAAGITAGDLEPVTDRGDGMLILIKPHDDVPKTLLLVKLVPILTVLLTEHNATVTRPDRVRLRAVVHAGEIHEDDKGFYGDDLDFACRLLDSPKFKQALREATPSPLALVVSEEIYQGIVQQGYLDGALYRPLCRVRVGRRMRRGWVHIPTPVQPDYLAAIPPPRDGRPSASLAPLPR